MTNSTLMGMVLGIVLTLRPVGAVNPVAAMDLRWGRQAVGAGITAVPANDATATNTATKAPTRTKTRTKTPTLTFTSVPTPTSTKTLIPTATRTGTTTATATRTKPATRTKTGTATATFTAIPTGTSTGRPTTTFTPIPPPVCLNGGQARRGVTLDGAAWQSVDAGTWSVAGAEMTVALWVNVTALTPEPYPTLLSKWDNGEIETSVFVLNTGLDLGAARMMIYSDDGTFVACTTDANAAPESPQLVVNQWHHIAATLDGTTLACYVDGVQTGTKGSWPAGRLIRQSGQTIRLGDRNDHRVLSGMLDDVRIYSRGLSAGEISAIYNRAAGSCDNAADHLEAWWKLDDGAGPTAADSSGNGHTGTLVNGATWAEAFVCCEIPPTATPSQTPTATATATPTMSPGPCTGDCNQSGTITIDELVACADIALRHTAVSRCRWADADGSGGVTVDELAQAVNAALRGCRPSAGQP